MANKFNSENKSKLDSPKRRECLPPYKVLEKFGLKKDDFVADIGCGIGYFTFPAGDVVGDKGKVFALDVYNEMIEFVETKIKEENISNIRTIISKENDLIIDKENVDLAFLCTVLHEVDEPEIFLKDALRIIKNGGSLAIVEWNKEESDFGPGIEERLDIDDVKKLLFEVGFKEVEDIELGTYFYGLKATK